MLKIGITGGIGSGKSIVCKIFEVMGIPVYYADERSKWLLHHDPDVVKQVKQLLGDAVYSAEGVPDRPAIASIVFKDPVRLKELEGILHPAVREDFNRWAEMQNAAYVLKEAALLYESKSYLDLDKIIVVTAPDELRIQRVMKRDYTGREQIIARMKQQWSQEKKAEMADYIIQNDDHSLLIPQVLKIHREVMGVMSYEL